MYNVYPTLEELQKEAFEDPVEINWETLDTNDHSAGEFEELLKTGTQTTNTLEELYKNLTNGNTELSYKEVEKYIDVLQTELVASYKIQDLLYRYMQIKEVIA